MFAFTRASQNVTDADDEQDSGRGRGPWQRVLSQPPVAFVLGQNLQNSEYEAQSGAPQSQSPEQDGLEGDHKLRGRVPVRAAESLQPRGGHPGLRGDEDEEESAHEEGYGCCEEEGKAKEKKRK